MHVLQVRYDKNIYVVAGVIFEQENIRPAKLSVVAPNGEQSILFENQDYLGLVAHACKEHMEKVRDLIANALITKRKFLDLDKELRQ